MPNIHATDAEEPQRPRAAPTLARAAYKALAATANPSFLRISPLTASAATIASEEGEGWEKKQGGGGHSRAGA